MSVRRGSWWISVSACAVIALAMLANLHAQTSDPNPQTGYSCQKIQGLTGCYYCGSAQTQSPGGAGCSNGQATVGQNIGTCQVSGTKGAACIGNTIDCGTNSSCASPYARIGACWSIPTCLDANDTVPVN